MARLCVILVPFTPEAQSSSKDEVTTTIFAPDRSSLKGNDFLVQWVRSRQCQGFRRNLSVPVLERALSSSAEGWELGAGGVFSAVGLSHRTASSQEGPPPGPRGRSVPPEENARGRPAGSS